MKTMHFITHTGPMSCKNLKHQVRNTPHSFIINISTVKYKYINIYRSTLSINKIKQQIVHWNHESQQTSSVFNLTAQMTLAWSLCTEYSACTAHSLSVLSQSSTFTAQYWAWVTLCKSATVKRFHMFKTCQYFTCIPYCAIWCPDWLYCFNEHVFFIIRK